MKYQVIVADPPWQASDKLAMSSVKRGAEANYPVMNITSICNLPVKEVADPNGCILALWVLGSMLDDGIKVMKSWGFKQKQIFVWVKTKKEPLDLLNKSLVNATKGALDIAKKIGISSKEIKEFSLAISNRTKLTKFSLDSILAFGMGRLFRQTHEICLIGINNTKIYKHLENKSQRSVCFKNNTGHSIKPESLQNSLELMFPKANKLEMFARRKRENWTNIGHNVSDGEDIVISLQMLAGKNE